MSAASASAKWGSVGGCLRTPQPTPLQKKRSSGRRQAGLRISLLLLHGPMMVFDSNHIEKTADPAAAAPTGWRNLVEGVALHSAVRGRRAGNAGKKPLNAGWGFSRAAESTRPCDDARFGREEKDVAIFSVQALAHGDLHLGCAASCLLSEFDCVRDLPCWTD